jgi:hypothetical protein
MTKVRTIASFGRNWLGAAKNAVSKELALKAYVR